MHTCVQICAQMVGKRGSCLTYVHIFVNTCVNKTASHDEGKWTYQHICESNAVIVHKCAPALVIRCSIVHSCAQIRAHLCMKTGDVVEGGALFCI